MKTRGWYKVMINGKWTVAYFDNSETTLYPWSLKDSDELYREDEFDEIGEYFDKSDDE